MDGVKYRKMGIRGFGKDKSREDSKYPREGRSELIKLMKFQWLTGKKDDVDNITDVRNYNYESV